MSKLRQQANVLTDIIGKESFSKQYKSVLKSILEEKLSLLHKAYEAEV